MEAIQDITEYIEIFYNRQRRQAKLGYVSPAAFAQRFYAGLWQHERFGVFLPSDLKIAELFRL